MLKISFWNWSKEINHGLCDVQQAQKSKLMKFTICETGIIYRNLQNFDLVFVPIKNVKPQTLSLDHEAILHVTENQGRYKITDIKSKQQDNNNEPLALIVNSETLTISKISTQVQQKKISINQKIIQLQEGALIMLGKARIEIIKISFTPKQASPNKNIYQRPQSIPFMSSIKRISVSNYQYSSMKQKNLNKTDSKQKLQQQLNRSKQKVQQFSRSKQKIQQIKDSKQKRQQIDRSKQRIRQIDHSQQKQKQKCQYTQVIVESPRSQQSPQNKNRQARFGSKQKQRRNSVEIMQFSMYDDNPTCKICYSKTIDRRNSLICLCKCSGSAKFTHQHCLKKWVQQKSGFQKVKQTQSKKVFKASMDGFQCQICKQYYCYDKIFRLILDLSEREQYIAMSMSINNKKYLFFVALNGAQIINFGRQIQSDITIAELTVSRQHCQLHINKQQNSISIIDLGSKFGTVLKKSSLMISSQNRTAIMQKGRTYIQFQKQMRKKKQGFFKKLFMCCEEMN